MSLNLELIDSTGAAGQGAPGILVCTCPELELQERFFLPRVSGGMTSDAPACVVRPFPSPCSFNFA